ncbi:hypothetical protein ABE28_019510 [Peribacillus muralis]|uniref:Uncharacterized protein n=2 Tax=Peribacillus muralis TaxID=264697 RepID=A0A1B3XTM8_9BACI|nr:hypothetical protein [Peribacillus muralis]AOH56560.1 hypothetical protein ABE28_019510 [Peribacillus muralis]
MVSIGDTKTVIILGEFLIPPDHPFDNVAFWQHGQITPAMFIGRIEVTYEYKDNMYQEKKMEFRSAYIR